MRSDHSTRRVILLNRFFHPDHSPTSELLSDLAFALARRGIDVSVISSRQTYEAAAALSPRDSIAGVEVWRVWTSRRGRMRLLGRSLDYLTFYLAAVWRAWRLARAGDIIVVMTDPPLLSVAIAPIAWIRRAHLVNWLQDIFPEVAAALHLGGRAGGIVFAVLRPPRNLSLRTARLNVVVGERMASVLQTQGVAPERFRVIQNWADGTVVRPWTGKENMLRKDWGLNDCFVVGYAGNLGRAHDVATLVEAMSLIEDRAKSAPDDISSQVRFAIIGGGARRAQLESNALKRKLGNMRLYPYQAKDRLAETMAVANIHLVSLNPALEGFIVPSKFYTIAAAGRPTLFIGAADGEIARLVREAGCGFTVPPGDGKALAARILELARDPELCATLGARAREAFERNWDKRGALANWEEALNACWDET